MRTIKLSMAVAAIAFSSVICQAQPGNGHPGKHPRGQHQKQDRGAKLAEKLNLTKKQAEQLKAIKEKQQAENKVINDKIAPLKTQMNALREQKKALNEVNRMEIEALLTPEQLIKYNELKERRKEHRINNRNK